MGNIFSKHFTVGEAEAWLPQLRGLFATIHALLEAVQDQVDHLRSSLVHKGNGGGIDVTRYFAGDAALDEALQEIQGAGILIKDIGSGLVDFPHLMGEHEVFLCWRLDDLDRLEWYHEIEAGFSGRRPLPRH